jgi:AcrR family transcriptional regulator
MKTQGNSRTGKAISTTDDHRVRVAAQRREKMKARLMEAAIVVLGARGVEASIIDEITALAGVSRGTFYNYFRTNDELMSAVSTEVGNEIVGAIMARFRETPDAVVRGAVGMRCWLDVASRYPHVARFFHRAGMMVLSQNLRARDEARRYVPMGAKAGRFDLDRPELAFDLMAGAVFAGINTIVGGGAREGYAEELVQRVLIGLGVDTKEAAAIAFAPLEPLVLPEDSLIARSASLSQSLFSVIA